MDTMFSLCLYDRLCIIVINLWTELAPGWLADDCSVGRLAQVAPFEPASRCANPHPDASCEFAKVGRLSSESCGFAMVVRWYKPTSVPRPPGAHRHPILIIVQLNFCKNSPSLPYYFWLCCNIYLQATHTPQIVLHIFDFNFFALNISLTIGLNWIRHIPVQTKSAD